MIKHPPELTEEQQVAQHYKAMGDSVWIINAMIDGSEMAAAEAKDKADCVNRNIKHLEIMVAKDFWTTEDMTAVNTAIAAGKNYLV